MSKNPEAVKIFTLYNQDVSGSTISYEIFKKLRGCLDPHRNLEVMYHATCFVCAVRRAGRLLESMSRRRSIFGEEVGKIIKLEWRKNKTFYDSFIEPRNAIEHIDNEANNKTNFAFFNLDNDKFMITRDKFIEINDYTMTKIKNTRDIICDAVIRHNPDPMLDQLDKIINRKYKNI